MTKSAEEVIKQVLAGLRDSEAPAGMERRILEGVRDRASAKSGSRWQSWRPMWRTEYLPFRRAARSWVWGVALAGTMAGCLAIFMVHRMDHAPVRALSSVTSEPPVTSEVAVVNTRPPLLISNPRPERKMKVGRGKFVSTSESVALREMRAASRPEPPMPLTEQEKLLLRFVQTRSPEELAAINPVKWATRDAEEKAEFEKFFGQSTTGDKE